MTTTILGVQIPGQPYRGLFCVTGGQWFPLAPVHPVQVEGAERAAEAAYFARFDALMDAAEAAVR